MTLRVLIRHTGYNHRGALWDCAVDDWPMWIPICESVRDPEHEAARALLKLGYRGPFETVDDRGMVRMRFPSIEHTAKRTVQESNGPPRFVAWKPHPMAAEKERRRELE